MCKEFLAIDKIWDLLSILFILIIRVFANKFGPSPAFCYITSWCSIFVEKSRKFKRTPFALQRKKSNHLFYNLVRRLINFERFCIFSGCEDHHVFYILVEIHFLVGIRSNCNSKRCKTTMSV